MVDRARAPSRRRCTPRPRRHSKPHVRPPPTSRARGSWPAAGGRRGIEVADLVAAITRATALDGEAVSDVTMLERFALLSVPAGEADRVIERASGVDVAGHTLSLERAGT